MFSALKALSVTILVYWAAFLSLFAYAAFIAPPQFSLPDAGFFTLVRIYLGCFPLMFVTVAMLWKRDLKYAKLCLAASIVLGLFTGLAWPTVE
jgi:hypothetical protein